MKKINKTLNRLVGIKNEHNATSNYYNSNSSYYYTTL